jgi:hypothetical protein
MTGEMKIWMTIGQGRVDESTAISIKQLSSSNGEGEYSIKLGKYMIEYYKDGYLYVNNSSRKSKSKVSFEKAIRREYTIKDNLTEAYFKDAAIENIDGDKKITCILPAARTKEIMEDIFTKPFESFVGHVGESKEKIKYGVTTVYLTIGSNGEIKKQEICPEFSMTFMNLPT